MDQDHWGIEKRYGQFCSADICGYVIAGTTESDSSGDSESWLVKVSGEPEGTENISVAGQTETGNTKRNINGISNKTETLAASQTRTLAAVPPETSTIILTEKAAKFEVVLAITALLLTITIRLNRR